MTAAGGTIQRRSTRRVLRLEDERR